MTIATSTGQIGRIRLIASLATQLVAMALPWTLRRRLLAAVLGFQLHETSAIGISIVFARCVSLGRGARIGHFNYIAPIDELKLDTSAIIGNSNVIGGRNSSYTDLTSKVGRRARLSLGEQAVVTHRHYLDCTGGICIGAFCIIAGGATQIFTHQIDVALCQQVAQAVHIGEYSIVSTRVTILPGATVPPRCVVGAGAVVTSNLPGSYALFAGVPARKVKQLPEDAAFFHRNRGHV